MSYIVLDAKDLALAALLLVLNGAISIGFRLGLERSLAIAALRMVAQLALAGVVLSFVFRQASPWWTAAIAVVMLIAAGHEVVSRQERRLGGYAAWGLGTSAMLVAGVSLTLFAVAFVIGSEPWHAPRYVLPILGMVLGNAMTGVALALDQITRAAYDERAAIETRLALGATRYDALGGILRRGLRTGLMPILNAMAAAGIVSLPGMMTGQIMAGADPVEATKYQVMIMFVIAGATALAVVIAGLGAIHLLTDERHRLRLDRLAPRKN